MAPGCHTSALPAARRGGAPWRSTGQPWRQSAASRFDRFPSLEPAAEDLYSVVGVFCFVLRFLNQVQYGDGVFVQVLELL